MTLILRTILYGLAITCLIQCSKPIELPEGDAGNGGLFIPGGFEALVVTDSIGRARHITVNDNGDIYVKLTFNDSMQGRGGTVGLRDTNADGKADVAAGKAALLGAPGAFLPRRLRPRNCPTAAVTATAGRR
jgi:hypothetical protein